MTTYLRTVTLAVQTNTALFHAIIGKVPLSYYTSGKYKNAEKLTFQNYIQVIKHAFHFKNHRISAILGVLESDFFDDEIYDQAKNDRREQLMKSFE